MSIQKLIDESLIEVARHNFRSRAFPPIWFAGAVMKTDTPELARVSKDESAFALTQNEVVVFGGTETGIFDTDFSSHAEMNAKPVVAGKSKQHALAVGRRSFQFCADKMLSEAAGIGSAKDAVMRVQAKIGNFVAAADIPLFSKPLNFGELRHGAEYAQLTAHQSNRPSPRDPLPQGEEDTKRQVRVGLMRRCFRSTCAAC